MTIALSRLALFGRCERYRDFLLLHVSLLNSKVLTYNLGL